MNAIDARISSNRPMIRKAERKKAKLRLALCGVTGSGKTYSALQLAFGLGSKVGLIDTEHGSGDLYADLGDYDVITLEPPFSVQKYRDAIRAFEEAGYDTIIVDSLSHAWSGEGGLLDKQGQLENSGKDKNSFATWREITPEHNKLVEQMLGSSAHVIATMRTKTEYVVEKDDRGKNTVRKLGLSPVQRDGVEYEFTVVLDVAENHTARASKDRTTLFDGWCDRISAATGRTLRQWLDSGTEPVRAMAASIAPAPVVRGDEWLDDAIPALDEFDVAPPPESAPRSMRDEINEAVPMKSVATVGLPDLDLPDPSAHTTHGTIDSSGRWKAWTAKVCAALGDTSSRAEVEAIAAHPVVAEAAAAGPAWVRRDLSAMLAGAWGH